ncbi:MAG TPA: ABC transporter substrate-binding protein [Chloroflexota bacterium]|nr:ABC transporter substrate-binding protein [Chloroflexota bacterium]
MALTEIHTDGLITADRDAHKQVGRLAEKVPSLDDGTIAVLPDGRMRVEFGLRKGVTWQDGAPFTAQDLVFSYDIGGPSGLPTSLNDAMEYVSGVEAPDDLTFVIYYKQPYFLGTALGPLMFWPLPQHLLGDAYARYRESGNLDDILSDPYWTSGYVNTGAFRLTSFDPGSGMDFQAYDGYYLGRPKIDVVYVRIFNDDSALESSLLAGAVDLTPELALRQATGVPLKERWQASGEGTVHVIPNAIRFLEPQWRPTLQMEPTVTGSASVRKALRYALDIEALSDAVNGGNPQLAAWSILPATDPLYEVTRDSLREFAYNPEKAQAALRDAGWTLGSDGKLRNDTDGRPFRTAIWGSLGTDQEIAACAAYWRAVGLDVDEHVGSAAESRDRAARAQFPGFELYSGEITTEIGQPAGTAQNRWTGNRNGFEDAEGQRLAAAFQSSLTLSDRKKAMGAINNYVVGNMLILPTFYQAAYMAARKGVKAYDDINGGFGAHVGANGYWGSYYRNAYLWDVDER